MSEITTIPRPATHQRIALALALWAFAYACYRAYYAAGGTIGMIGMIGQPVSDSQFRAIKAYGDGAPGWHRPSPGACC